MKGNIRMETLSYGLLDASLVERETARQSPNHSHEIGERNSACGEASHVWREIPHHKATEALMIYD